MKKRRVGRITYKCDLCMTRFDALNDLTCHTSSVHKCNWVHACSPCKAPIQNPRLKVDSLPKVSGAPTDGFKGGAMSHDYLWLHNPENGHTNCSKPSCKKCKETCTPQKHFDKQNKALHPASTSHDSHDFESDKQKNCSKVTSAEELRDSSSPRGKFKNQSWDSQSAHVARTKYSKSGDPELKAGVMCGQETAQYPASMAVDEGSDNHDGGSKPCMVFECRRCFLQFSQITDLIQHNISMHGEKSLEFRPQSNIKKQPDEYNGGHVCSSCSKSFKTPEERFQHFETVHIRYNNINRRNQADLRCRHCHLKFTREFDLKYHEFEMHEKYQKEAAFNCVQSQTFFNTSMHLPGHTKATHMDTANSIRFNVNNYGLDHINKQDCIDMVNHRFGVQGRCRQKRRPILRPLELFKTAKDTNQSESAMHLSSDFSALVSSSDEGDQYNCILDSKLKSHRSGNGITGLNEYNCAECGLNFHQKPDLMKHMEGHQQFLETRQKFEDCAAFWQHVWSQFKCHKCRLVFATELELAQHLVEHSSTVNSASYVAQQRITSHKRGSGDCGQVAPSLLHRLHSQIDHRPDPEVNLRSPMPTKCPKDKMLMTHSCIKCPMVFHKFDQLQKHKLTVHGTRQYSADAEISKLGLSQRNAFEYKCKVCGTCFEDQMRLDRHMLYIHKAPYYCSDCKCRFGSVEDLLQHRLDVHFKKDKSPKCDALEHDHQSRKKSSPLPCKRRYPEWTDMEQLNNTKWSAREEPDNRALHLKTNHAVLTEGNTGRAIPSAKRFKHNGDAESQNFTTNINSAQKNMGMRRSSNESYKRKSRDCDLLNDCVNECQSISDTVSVPHKLKRKEDPKRECSAENDDSGHKTCKGISVVHEGTSSVLERRSGSTKKLVKHGRYSNDLVTFQEQTHLVMTIQQHVPNVKNVQKDQGDRHIANPSHENAQYNMCPVICITPEKRPNTIDKYGEIVGDFNSKELHSMGNGASNSKEAKGELETKVKRDSCGHSALSRGESNLHHSYWPLQNDRSTTLAKISSGLKQFTNICNQDDSIGKEKGKDHCNNPVPSNASKAHSNKETGSIKKESVSPLCHYNTQNDDLGLNIMAHTDEVVIKSELISPVCENDSAADTKAFLKSNDAQMANIKEEPEHPWTNSVKQEFCSPPVACWENMVQSHTSDMQVRDRAQQTTFPQIAPSHDDCQNLQCGGQDKAATCQQRVKCKDYEQCAMHPWIKSENLPSEKVTSLGARITSIDISIQKNETDYGHGYQESMLHCKEEPDSIRKEHMKINPTEFETKTPVAPKKALQHLVEVMSTESIVDMDGDKDKRKELTPPRTDSELGQENTCLPYSTNQTESRDAGKKKLKLRHCDHHNTSNDAVGHQQSVETGQNGAKSCHLATGLVDDSDQTEDERMSTCRQATESPVMCCKHFHHRRDGEAHRTFQDCLHTRGRCGKRADGNVWENIEAFLKDSLDSTPHNRSSAAGSSDVMSTSLGAKKSLSVRPGLFDSLSDVEWPLKLNTKEPASPTVFSDQNSLDEAIKIIDEDFTQQVALKNVEQALIKRKEPALAVSRSSPSHPLVPNHGSNGKHDEAKCNSDNAELPPYPHQIVQKYLKSIPQEQLSLHMVGRTDVPVIYSCNPVDRLQTNSIVDSHQRTAQRTTHRECAGIGPSCTTNVECVNPPLEQQLQITTEHDLPVDMTKATLLRQGVLELNGNEGMKHTQCAGTGVQAVYQRVEPQRVATTNDANTQKVSSLDGKDEVIDLTSNSRQTMMHTTSLLAQENLVQRGPSVPTCDTVEEYQMVPPIQATFRDMQQDACHSVDLTRKLQTSQCMGSGVSADRCGREHCSSFEFDQTHKKHPASQAFSPFLTCSQKYMPEKDDTKKDIALCDTALNQFEDSEKAQHISSGDQSLGFKSIKCGSKLHQRGKSVPDIPCSAVAIKDANKVHMNSQKFPMFSWDVRAACQTLPHLPKSCHDSSQTTQKAGPVGSQRQTVTTRGWPRLVTRTSIRSPRAQELDARHTGDILIQSGPKLHLTPSKTREAPPGVKRSHTHTPLNAQQQTERQEHNTLKADGQNKTGMEDTIIDLTDETTETSFAGAVSENYLQATHSNLMLQNTTVSPSRRTAVQFSGDLGFIQCIDPGQSQCIEANASFQSGMEKVPNSTVQAPKQQHMIDQYVTDAQPGMLLDTMVPTRTDVPQPSFLCKPVSGSRQPPLGTACARAVPGGALYQAEKDEPSVGKMFHEVQSQLMKEAPTTPMKKKEFSAPAYNLAASQSAHDVKRLNHCLASIHRLPCPYCYKSYLKKKYLRRHMLLHHPDRMRCGSHQGRYQDKIDFLNRVRQWLPDMPHTSAVRVGRMGPVPHSPWKFPRLTEMGRETSSEQSEVLAQQVHIPSKVIKEAKSNTRKGPGGKKLLPTPFLIDSKSTHTKWRMQQHSPVSPSRMTVQDFDDPQNPLVIDLSEDER